MSALTRMRIAGPPLVIGALAVAALAIANGIPGSHLVELVALALGAALLAGFAGALALGTLRRRSVATQAVAVSLTTGGGVALGAWAAAHEMFIAADDLVALEIVLIASSAIGIMAALVLGARVGRVSASLAAAAHQLGDGAAVIREAPERVAPRELSQLAEQLRDTSERLERARRREAALDDSRRELVAWVSHDLRTPLAGIRAITEALEDHVVVDPETVARYHRTLRQEADRLAALVDDLFELSRAQAGVLALQLERVSLGDLVSDAIAGATAVAAAKGVRLEGRLDGPAPELHASAPELLRALRNILENAIRHTPSDGSVIVEAGGASGAAFVSIVDAGGGIRDADLDRVFEVAFRGDPARTPDDDRRGGLGLAIAQTLVEAHRGAIEVRNDGRGARFTVRLPLESA